jgi:isoquinoline 1-oxidoreductase alpha subunit
MSITLTVNGSRRTIDDDPQTPLLWVIRDTLGLTGTKYGCGLALCGACTVHLDGTAIRSCVTPVSAASNVTKSRSALGGSSRRPRASTCAAASMVCASSDDVRFQPIEPLALNRHTRV